MDRRVQWQPFYGIKMFSQSKFRTNEPCIYKCFTANLSFSSRYILHIVIAFAPPLPMEEGGLAEYVCTHPCFVVGLQSNEDRGRVRVTACFPTVCCGKEWVALQSFRCCVFGLRPVWSVPLGRICTQLMNKCGYHNS